jgi:DNA-binding transcriptional LysR family regulator
MSLLVPEGETFVFTHFWSIRFLAQMTARCQALFSCSLLLFLFLALYSQLRYCLNMDIQQLKYLAALAREKHFTRAAAACNITQPTLSGRIRQLEQELGVPLLERGQRFIGLTPEGERVLKWAHLILDNWQSLQGELKSIKGKKGQLVGRLVVGVIPSAMPKVSLLTKAMNAAHPAVDFTILSHSSEDIIRGLSDFSIEAGITYLDNEPVEGLLQAELYRENYCLFVAAEHELAQRSSVTWFEAAQQPLCLLTPNMQNRRIIDRAFAAAKAHPVARLETNSIMNLISSVRSMELCSIMPDYFATVMGSHESLVAVPLAEPTVSHKVGLVAINRDPQSPLVAALFSVLNHK